MKKIKLCMAYLALAALLLGSIGAAQAVQGDLQSRFSDEQAIEYQGQSYNPKNRLTTMLFAAFTPADEQRFQLQLIYLLLADDDLDRIVPIQLDAQTLLSAPEFEGLTLDSLFNREPPPEETDMTPDEVRAASLLEGVNSLFPSPLIESHMVLDVQGLDILDGGPSDTEADPQAALKSRLKSILAAAEQESSSAQMDMFDSLSGYLTTDVKTGALMKMAKKAERYDVLPTQLLPGAFETNAGNAAFYRINQEDLTPFLIEYFYEEPLW